MTRRTKVLVLVVVAAVLAGVLAIGGVAVVAWQIGRQAKTAPDPTPLTDADKRLLFTAADIARIDGPPVDPEGEKWSSLRQGNGTRFILYLYESKSEPRISIYSRLVILPHPAGARSMYQADKLMMKLGSGGVSYVPAPHMFPEGGDRSAWFIEKDGDRIGNFFLIREGRFIQSARITGLLLYYPADVQRLLGPMRSEARRRASAEGGPKR